jgi:signal transduction histidine kinase
MHKMARADLRDLTRLNQLIDNMLDVTRLTMGKRPFMPVELDLSEAVKETVQRFQQVHPGVIELAIDPSIRGQFDLLQIEQVLMNLLSNAVKYGDKKPVRVTLASPAPGRARIEVQDDGPGIAPEHHGRIFQKFERLQPKDKVSGLGLGLYICRELVQRQGGSIDFTSEPGQGTTFRVDLPLSPATS